MRPASPDEKPQVVFDTHGYRLSERQEGILRENLDVLKPQIENFPFADFRIVIEGNLRSNEVVVKVSLALPGSTLVVSDHDANLRPAFERCLDSLQTELQAYKDRLGRVAERQKHVQGTHQELLPASLIDAEAIERAIETEDYAAFRAALLPYEEEVRKVVGRWVQRYPAVDAQIDRTIKLDDLVEEVFLLAFDGYRERPASVTLGTWLHSRVDPAVRAILSNREEELENIALVRTALDAGIGQQGPESGGPVDR